MNIKKLIFLTFIKVFLFFSVGLANEDLWLCGNRNYLKGINLIGLRRKKYDNKKIMELDQAYKKIFSSNNLHENLSKINGEYKENELVQEVTKFIEKDKRRPICSPLSE